MTGIALIFDMLGNTIGQLNDIIAAERAENAQLREALDAANAAIMAHATQAPPLPGDDDHV